MGHDTRGQNYRLSQVMVAAAMSAKLLGNEGHLRGGQGLVRGDEGANKLNGGQGHICMMRRFAPQWLRESLAIRGQVASIEVQTLSKVLCISSMLSKTHIQLHLCGSAYCFLRACPFLLLF